MKTGFRKLRRYRAIFAQASTVVALSALSAGVAMAQDVVRLGNLKFAHYGAVSYMKEICPKYNIKIDEKVFQKGIDILPAIAAGEIDMSASGLDGAIAGRAQGLPVYIVASFAKGGVRLVAAKESGITTVQSLKGRKVGVARGGTQELALLAELDKYGLSWSDKPGKDVQTVYMNYPDLNQALQAKNIDAMSQSEPYSSQAISKGFGTEITKPYDTPMGAPARALVMTEKLHNERPDVALRTMKCFVDATQKFLKEPEVAEKYVREVIFRGQVSSQDYKDAIENSPFSFDLTVEHVQITTDYMQKLNVGRMANPPKAVDYVKLDLLNAAVASLPKS